MGLILALRPEWTARAVGLPGPEGAVIASDEGSGAVTCHVQFGDELPLPVGGRQLGDENKVCLDSLGRHQGQVAETTVQETGSACHQDRTGQDRGRRAEDRTEDKAEQDRREDRRKDRMGQRAGQRTGQDRAGQRTGPETKDKCRTDDRAEDNFEIIGTEQCAGIR